MPMTIERASRRPLRWLAGKAGLLAVTLAVWFGGMAAAAALWEPSEAIVFGSRADVLLAQAPADVRIVSAGAGFVVLHGERKGWVRDLYRGGAWFVWPASAAGCGSRQLRVAGL